METPDTLRYAKSHEWARLDDDGLVTVGITDHAQQMLGDLVFVEPPEAGRHYAAGAECAVVESVKAASDIYAPVAGTVAAVNEELQGAPERINESPYGTWLFKLKPDNAEDVKQLLTAAQYRALVESEAA